MSEIREADLMENITYISHQSYLFKGTVRDNLLMGKPDASDSELWEVLERVNLADFVRNEKGLDTGLSEKASNLSGLRLQGLFSTIVRYIFLMKLLLILMLRVKTTS